MDWREYDVSLEGARIHYYRRGSGRPIVAAHGFGDNGRCWTRVARALEDRYDIVAPDARSHGRSDDGPAAPGADIIGLVQALGLERPALLGHSMGAGSVAAAAAARPELFACAVLEDPGWRSGEQASRPRPPRRDYSGLTVDQLVAEARERNRGWDEIELQDWAESKLQLRPGVPLPPAEPDAWKETVRRLAGLPVLLITGDVALGSIVSEETEAEARRLCPTLEVVHLAGAGHNIRRERFHAYVDAVAAFIGRFA